MNTVELKITDVAYRGRGVARLDGCVVFVPGALPGETVRARIVEQRRKFAVAQVDEVVEASPSRVAPACPLSRECPGCVYQHVDYEAEVALKQAQLQSLMSRIAGLNGLPFAGPVPSPADLWYRNRLVLHTGPARPSRVLGYVAEDNRTIIDVPLCPLGMRELNDLLARLRGNDDFWNSLAAGSTVTLRHSEDQGALYWVDDGDADGGMWLRESTAIGALWLHRGDFVQVNPGAAGLLLGCVKSLLEQIRPEVVIDLYCGAGVFALQAGLLGVPSVLGIDSSGSSIQAARRNAGAMELKGVEFVSARAEDSLAGALGRVDVRGTTLILDPPRRGLDRALLDVLVEERPAHLVYISCAPDTMARDLKALKEAGYGLNSCQLIDMFPRTYCFETIAHLAAGR